MISDVKATLDLARSDPHFLGNIDALKNSVWRAGPDGQTEYLVPKDSADVPASGLEPAVLKAIVQMPMGPTTAFRRGNISFVVGAVSKDDHPLFHKEYKQVAKNMEAIRQSVPPRVSQTGFGLGEGMEYKMKMSHAGFEDRPTNAASGETQVDLDEPGLPEAKDILEDLLDHDVDYQFRIANLLPVVSPACRPLLKELISTTCFNPLPAVLESDLSNAIVPALYQSVLCGAVIELGFTFSHKIIARPSGKFLFFKATVDKITVLDTPSTISLSPSKQVNKRLFRRGYDSQDEDRSYSTSANQAASNEAGPSEPLAKRKRKA